MVGERVRAGGENASGPGTARRGENLASGASAQREHRVSHSTSVTKTRRDRRGAAV